MICRLTKLNSREWSVQDLDGNYIRCSCGRKVVAILENDNTTKGLNPCGKVDINNPQQ